MKSKKIYYWLQNFSRKFWISLAIAVVLVLNTTAQAPSNPTVIPDATLTLGNYPNTSVALSGNTTITPSAVPTNTTSINVSTNSNFKGTFAANTATGVVTVTDAHPSGVYTVTVRAFGTGGTTAGAFTLTVTNGIACTGASFTNAADVGVGNGPASVAIGDFNGDGNQDIAAANQTSNTVSIRLGNGAGGFTSPPVPEVSAGTRPISVAIGDFDGNGKQDIAVANNNTSTVSIRLGNGAGGFTSPSVPQVTVGDSPASVAIGDFNGDGKQDLAVANLNSNTVSIRLGNGSGGFTSPSVPEVTVGTGPFSVAIGDFNGDGIQDFATANFNSMNVSIRLGNGAGGFTSPTVPEVAVVRGPISVAIGDFNGDGRQEL